MDKNYLILDFETTATTSYKRTANPFDPRNKVIVKVFQHENDKEVTCEYDRKGLTQINLPWDTFDTLIGHNIKFDLLYIWKDPKLREWLRNGGKIYDTMVAEYLLTAQMTNFASLNSLSQKYGGTLKDDRVSEYFEVGLGSDYVDPEILLPYACHDILNTRKVYEEQQREIQRQGMGQLIEVYMDHLLATTEMEANGLTLDFVRAEKMVEEYTIRCSRIANEIKAYLSPEFIEKTQFSVDSNAHLSAILFNTPLKTRVQVDTGKVYGKTAKKAGQSILRWETSETQANVFNVKPIDKNGEYFPSSKTGVYHVGSEILEDLLSQELEDESAKTIINQILDYRESKKILTTYLRGVKISKGKQEETGLIPLVQGDGQIHHTLNLVSTVTGRLSSKNPNSQNIPGSLKSLFKSRFGEEGRIVEIDYCLDPSTRILTEDFIWVPIGNIKEGDTLIGFPEQARIHDGARWAPSTVEKVKRLMKPSLEIVTTEGVIRCSRDHMWKVSRGTAPLVWKRSDELKVGWSLSKVMEVWDTPCNAETGWMAGFLDGEGYLGNSSQIGWGQNDFGDNKIVFDEAIRLSNKYLVNIEQRYCRKKPCVEVRPAGLRTGWQAVGVFQPKRLKEKLKRSYTETTIRSKRNRKVKILEIRDTGIQEVVAVQTSTKTFLAEGFLSHNCQLEVGIQAYLTQSESMIEDIKNGVDFHCKRLAYAEDKSYDEVVKLVKDLPNIWGSKRRAAKTISFQKAYGAQPESLARTTGLPLMTVKKIFAEEDNEYPEISAFVNDLMEGVERSRIPSGKPLQIYDKDTDVSYENPNVQGGVGFWKSVTGKRYHFIELAVDSKKLRESRGELFRYFSKPQGYNYPVQGLASDLVSLMVGRLFRGILKVEKVDPSIQNKLKLINEVHDSVILDIHVSHESKVNNIIEALEDVSNAWEQKFNTKFNVPITVDTKIGHHWGEE